MGQGSRPLGGAERNLGWVSIGSCATFARAKPFSQSIGIDNSTERCYSNPVGRTTNEVGVVSYTNSVGVSNRRTERSEKGEGIMSSLTDEISEKEMAAIEKAAKEIAQKAYEKAKQELERQARERIQRQQQQKLRQQGQHNTQSQERKSVLEQLNKNQQKLREQKLRENQAKTKVNAKNKSVPVR